MPGYLTLLQCGSEGEKQRQTEKIGDGNRDGCAVKSESKSRIRRAIGFNCSKRKTGFVWTHEKHAVGAHLGTWQHRTRKHSTDRGRRARMSQLVCDRESDQTERKKERQFNPWRPPRQLKDQYTDSRIKPRTDRQSQRGGRRDIEPGDTAFRQAEDVRKQGRRNERKRKTTVIERRNIDRLDRTKKQVFSKERGMFSQPWRVVPDNGRQRQTHEGGGVRVSGQKPFPPSIRAGKNFSSAQRTRWLTYEKQMRETTKKKRKKERKDGPNGRVRVEAGQGGETSRNNQDGRTDE